MPVELSFHPHPPHSPQTYTFLYLIAIPFPLVGPTTASMQLVEHQKFKTLTHVDVDLDVEDVLAQIECIFANFSNYY